MPSDEVVGVVVVSRESAPTPSPPSTPTSCPTTFTCPENDGCVLQGSRDQVYALSCSTDYYGGDFTSLWAESLPLCAQACVENSQCVAASFGGGSGAGTCYLKDKNNGAGASENADGKTPTFTLSRNALDICANIWQRSPSSLLLHLPRQVQPQLPRQQRPPHQSLYPLPHPRHQRLPLPAQRSLHHQYHHPPQHQSPPK
jgi:hypothetical protein